MEIIKMIALALSAILLLTACSPNDSYSLEYQEHPLRALLAFEHSGISVTALLSIIPKSNSDGVIERDVTLTFRSPNSLAGITIEQTGGNIYTSCGDLKISDSAADAWLEVAELFNIDGTIKRIYISDIQGQDYNCVEALGNDGKDYKIYLHENGEPRRIVSPSLTVDVLSFESAQ